MDSETTRPHARRLVVATALATGVLLTACGGEPAPSQQPRQPQQQQQDGGNGVPGAIDRAGQVKDQTNQRTRDLEDQVQTYRK